MNEAWDGTERAFILVEEGDEGDGGALAALREQAVVASREFARLARTALELIVLLAAIALPWIFRAATVAFMAWAVSRAYPALSERLGGDPPAVLLALTVVLLPAAGALGLAQAHRAEPWGAFVAAGGAIYLLGLLARAATPLSAALAVGSAFAGVVVYALFEGRKETETQGEQEEVSRAEQQSAW